MKHFGSFLLLTAACSVVHADGMPPISHIEKHCGRSDTHLVVQTVIEVDGDQTFWVISCDLLDDSCRAFVLPFAHLEDGRLSLLASALPDKLEIESKTAEVFVLSWGPWRKLIVDLYESKVFYKEDSPDGSSRGTGPCQ
mgnify:CR=1 FL=1